MLCGQDGTEPCVIIADQVGAVGMSERQKRSLKLDELILAVLREADEPLHSGEITRRVMDSGYKFRSQSPERSVGQYLKARQFVRVGRGMYRLGMPGEKKRSLKIDELILDVLREASEPLHYMEITRRLMDRGYRFRGPTPDLTVNSCLSRGSQFVRVGRGTYRVSSGEARGS